VSGRRVGPVDSLWLNMDRPNNLMVVEALVLLERPVAWERLLELVRSRLIAPFPVFRQCAVRTWVPFGWARWRDDPEFDLSRHVRRVTLRESGDDGALRSYVEQHIRDPLDPAHPLWEVHLIEGYGRGAALFCRMHHALADGVTLARLLLSLTDDTRVGSPSVAHPPRESTPRGRHASAVSIGRAGATAAATAVTDAAVVAGRFAQVCRPRFAAALLSQALRGVVVANKLLLSHSPASILDREPGVEKLAVWSAPFPLGEIKQAGHAAGATVNDVLMSALAGAISTYLVEHGRAAADLLTMVPVNMRPLDQTLAGRLGNRFALAFIPLPVSITEPWDRLLKTKRRMDAIKHSPEAIMTFALIYLFGLLPPAVERHLVDFFAGKAIGVTTNVPGPTTPRYLAGSRVGGLLAWVPSSGPQNLGVCIVTYNNTVRIGFKVDAATIPDPERLMDAMTAQLKPLLASRPRRKAPAGKSAASPARTRSVHYGRRRPAASPGQGGSQPRAR
jgi:diacylglycerol O-acyltransferase